MNQDGQTPQTTWDWFIKVCKDIWETKLLLYGFLILIILGIVALRWLYFQVMALVTFLCGIWYVFAAVIVIAIVALLLKKWSAGRKPRRAIERRTPRVSGGQATSFSVAAPKKTKYRMYFWQIWLPKRSKTTRPTPRASVSSFGSKGTGKGGRFGKK